MIYLYQTIAETEGAPVKRYEIKQSMHDAPLTHHPETHEPIRRVLTGGMGFITGKKPASPPRLQPGCGCGHGCCGHR